MNKDKKWAQKEIKKVRDLLNNKRYEEEVDDFTTGVLSGLKKALNILDKLDQPETLSKEWIDGKKLGIRNRIPFHMDVDYAVPEEDLKNLLVPKQELPVIPQVIADWLEECKGWNDDEQVYDEDNAINLLGAIDLDNAGMSDEVYDYLVDNSETFAKAWFFGYKIKEKREFLVMSNGLDGVVHYFTRFNDEMNALFTLPNSKRNAYKFKDKAKAQSIADYIDGEVKEV